MDTEKVISPKKTRWRPKVLSDEEYKRTSKKVSLTNYYKIKQDPIKYQKLIEKQKEYRHKRAVKVCWFLIKTQLNKFPISKR